MGVHSMAVEEMAVEEKSRIWTDAEYKNMRL